jgi:hypothetical protein
MIAMSSANNSGSSLAASQVNLINNDPKAWAERVGTQFATTAN